MTKFQEKREKFSLSVLRLREAVLECEKGATDIMKDGLIQRFEFCTELAWKALREYLLDQGYVELNSPKSVMRKAYADGLVADETMWLSILEDRNRTSHLYDERTADEIFMRISKSYLSGFEALAKILNNAS